jgi:hypothetical protein
LNRKEADNGLYTRFFCQDEKTARLEIRQCACFGGW